MPIRRIVSESNSESNSAARAESPVKDDSPGRALIKAAVVGPVASTSSNAVDADVKRASSPCIRKAAIDILLITSNEGCSFREASAIVSKYNPSVWPQSAADLSDGITAGIWALSRCYKAAAEGTFPVDGVGTGDLSVSMAGLTASLTLL